MLAYCNAAMLPIEGALDYGKFYKPKASLSIQVKANIK